MLLEIQQHMILQEILLFDRVHIRHLLQLFKMRPALFIHSLEFIEPAWGKQLTNGYMHEVLFLFLGEFLLYLSKFLDADEEQDAFQVRLLRKSFCEFRFQVPPALLKVVSCKHAAKLMKLQQAASVA